MASNGGRRPGAGRKKGTKNRRTVELEHLLAERFPGYDPVVAMAEMANDDSLDDSLRASCHKEVAKYCRPQLKAIEHSTTGGGIELTWNTGVPDASK